MKKIIIVGSLALYCLVFLIYLLVFPLGFISGHYYCYSNYHNQVISVITNSKPDRKFIDTPFTVLGELNIPQIVVFSVVAIAFVALTVLFLLEVKRTTPNRPTKAERLQQQVDDLQKQIDELKKGE